MLTIFKLKENKDDGTTSEDSDVDSDVEEDAKDSDYDYLLGMAMWSLTAEKKEELLRKKDEKHKELDKVKGGVFLDGSPGLVVKEGDSTSDNCEFEFWRWILDITVINIDKLNNEMI